MPHCKLHIVQAPDQIIDKIQIENYFSKVNILNNMRDRKETIAASRK